MGGDALISKGQQDSATVEIAFLKSSFFFQSSSNQRFVVANGQCTLDFVCLLACK
jgi:hypothetical protein